VNQTEEKSIGSLLLEFQQKLHNCKSLRELSFVSVNDTFSVLQYDQAVVWYYDIRGAISVSAVSGLAEIAVDTPYVQWLGRAIQFLLINRPDPVSALPFDEFPETLTEDGREWVHENILHCLLHSPEGKVLGGLFLNRHTTFEDQELAVARWVASSIGFAAWAWRQNSQKITHVTKAFEKRSVQYAVAAGIVLAAVLGFVPIRLSALVPAEITPTKPFPITAPIDGVIRKIVIQPNQVVKADEAVAELDDTSIRNRLAVATKAFETASTDYQRAVNKSFNDEQSKGELLVLGSKVQEKSAEVAYLSELLEKLRITAPQGGIAIFSDAEDLRGRPVQTGERIMVVADPSLVGVTVYLPPDDAVELEVGGDVTVYLNIAPLSPLNAKIVQSSYEAMVQPDNTVAYIIKAALEPGSGLPRIGNKGTAKVFGKSVSLGYYLFRKPILFLRRSLGV
jgi:multidrug resistance efflux pump